MKIVIAQQAKPLNTYKNTRMKLLKTNAAIWFNKVCKTKELQPTYINIRSNGKTDRDHKMINLAVRHRIKNWRY